MIRRNTASQVIYLPALLLKADGAAVTSGATIVVAKDGTEASSAGTLDHYANGVWKYTPTQAETDAAIVGLVLTATNASPVVVNLVTTGADTGAVALGALTTLGTNAPSNWINAGAIASNAITDAKIASDAITAAKIASNAITDAKIASNAFTAAKFAAGAFDAVWTVATRTLTAISDSSGVTTLLSRIIGTLATGTHNPQSGDSFARLGAPVGASISADIATRLAASSYTAPPTAAANADAVWDEAIADHLTAGSTGASLNAAGSSGDPWTTTLPGSYTGTQAGKILADILADTAVLPASFPSNFASLGINSSGHVSRVVLVDTTTTNTDMRGTDSALLASSYTAPPSAEDNATQVRTELDIELGRIDATISSRSTFAGGAVDSVTGAVGSVTSPVTVGTNNDKTGYALTQSFPSNFASLGINSSGHVSRVVLVDTTTTNTDVTAVAAEVGKIPRGASAIAAGGNATRTKVSADGTTLVEAIT
jgi:hypothetical protein